MIHPYFTIPAMMMKYKENTYRFVSGNEVQIGQEVVVGQDKNGKILIVIVQEILEERKSMGNFKNYDVPFSYRLVAK